MWLLLFPLWIFLAVIPARVAANKGRSEAGFFLFGLLFFLPALIVALIISPDLDELGRTQGVAAVRNRYGNAAAAPPLRTTAVPPRLDISQIVPVEALEKLAALKDSGALSDEEFAAAKQRLLFGSGGTSPSR